MTTRPATVMAAVLALFVAAGSGCAGGVGELSIPQPPSTTVARPAPPDSLPANLDSIGEAPVGGVTTTTQPVLGPGAASLVGTVTNPAGQTVSGATVEIDRVVGDRYVSATTAAGSDGAWAFHGILGGNYRVRAWMAPNLDMPTPVQVFLANGASQTVTLQVTAYQLDQLQVAMNPSDPIVGQPANLVIQVTNPAVNSAGVLSSPPVPGATVTLVNGNNWQVDNGNPLTTNAYGQATFVVACNAPGSDPLSAEVNGGTPTDLQMPACTAAPTTTTTVYNYYATTTTCPPSADTTTTYQFGGSC